MARRKEFQNWKPVPIEEYYSEVPDKLVLWKVLEITEEKEPLWYADEPNATSEKHDIRGLNIFRTTFHPEGNLSHLMAVAKALGIESLPIKHNDAYLKVLSIAKAKQQSESS